MPIKQERAEDEELVLGNNWMLFCDAFFSFPEDVSMRASSFEDNICAFLVATLLLSAFLCLLVFNGFDLAPSLSE